MFLFFLAMLGSHATDSVMAHTDNSQTPVHCRANSLTNWTCGPVGSDDANYEQTNQSGNMVFADFDGDGDVDAAGAALRTTDFQVVFRQCSNDSATDPWSCTDTPIAALASIGYFQQAAAGDVDGDGDADVITGDLSPFVCENDGGSFSACTEYSTSPSGSVSARHIVDVDGDGDGDLLAWGGDVCEGTGGSFACTTPAAGWDAFIGDFDEDGSPDFVHENQVCLNDGPGPGPSFSCSTSPASQQGFTLMSGTGTGQSTAVGDFDGDGDLDYASASQNRDQMAACFGDGAGGFTCSVNPITFGGGAMVAGDFDGDGDDELLTYWSGTTPAVCSPNRSGTGSCVASNLPEFNINSNQLVVADDFSTSTGPLIQPDIQVSGGCPGIIDLSMSGFTPFGTVELGTSPSTGSYTLPNSHQCGGTNLGTGVPTRRRVSLIADANGEINFQRSFTNAGVCATYIQLLDLDSCTTLDTPLQLAP